MTDWNRLDEAFQRQRQYSDLFFNTEFLSTHEKEEITKTFMLSLHAEASDLVSSINLKNHRRQEVVVDKNKILYKSVDLFRYMIATMNLWGFTPQEFVDACNDKDLFLHCRHRLTDIPRGDRPVVIFDVDDVIAHFRDEFSSFLQDRYGIVSDPEDKQYYNTAEMAKIGLESDSAFSSFISDGGFKRLKCAENVLTAMKTLRERGVWIQLLTARPQSNLKCYYDTFQWLETHSVPYDGIAFSPEKYLWLTGQDFFSAKKLLCAIDDSSKHASEYAKHGVRTIVPAMSYNAEISNMDLIHRLSFQGLEPDRIVQIVLGEG